MDARITKHRLGNLLSYDWLKILATVAAAIFGLSAFFTMVRARPSNGQVFDFQTYGGLTEGEYNYRLTDALESMFSYDILQTSNENFKSDSNGMQVFTARRAVKTGTVIVAADYSASEETPSPFASLCEMGLVDEGTDRERQALFFDVNAYLSDTQKYLSRFFSDWEHGEAPDKDKVQAYFSEVSKKDKRFRSAEDKEKGVELEEKRILKIRDDYLKVRTAFENNVLTIRNFKTEQGEYPVGIDLHGIGQIGELFTYQDSEGGGKTDALSLLIYDNGEDSVRNKYEVVTLLAYLLEHYN